MHIDLNPPTRIGDPTPAERREFDQAIADRARRITDVSPYQPSGAQKSDIAAWLSGINADKPMTPQTQTLVKFANKAASEFMGRLNGIVVDVTAERMDAENLKEGSESLKIHVVFSGPRGVLEDLNPIRLAATAAIVAENWIYAHNNFKRTLQPGYTGFVGEMTYEKA